MIHSVDFRVGIGAMVGARNVKELDELYYNMTLSGKNSEIIFSCFYDL